MQKEKTAKNKRTRKDQLSNIISNDKKGNGDIDNATLREELKKEGLTIKTEGDTLPWEVVYDKYIFTIDENYGVEEVNGISLSKKEIKLISGENETITATLTEGTTGKNNMGKFSTRHSKSRKWKK